MKISKDKQHILEKLILELQFNNLNEYLLDKISKELYYDENYWRLLFEDSITAVITSLNEQRNIGFIQSTSYDNQTSIRSKIKHSIYSYMLIYNKKTSKNMWNFYKKLPNHSILANDLYKTSDVMWHHINDVSTDINFYTKRLILSTILLITNIFYHEKNTEGNIEKTLINEELKIFIDKIIDRLINFISNSKEVILHISNICNIDICMKMIKESKLFINEGFESIKNNALILSVMKYLSFI